MLPCNFKWPCNLFNNSSIQLQLCNNKMLKKSWTCSFLIFSVRLLFNVTVIWGHVFIYFESNNPWNSVIGEGPQIASISPTCQSCYTRIKFNTLVLADSQQATTSRLVIVGPEPHSPLRNQIASTANKIHNSYTEKM